ncbi:MAG: hypothetical protein J5860_00850 [Clostridia bacterium]|nr:hypothetical protein [Clostridia bacterium]MBO4428917.1 hypothetical protein [Clostridia bacterium]
MATFYNQATLSYGGVLRTSNVVSGEIRSSLSVTKTAVSDSYGAGGSVTYVVSIINADSTAFTGLTLTDDLGAFEFGTQTLYPLTYDDGSLLYYVNGVLQATPATSGTEPLVITGINVPANGNATIVYGATVNEYADPTAGATIVNTATLSGVGIADVAAEETVTAGDNTELTISKSLTPASIVENGSITYAFLIQNTGNTEADAAQAVVLTDTFDPALSGITVTLDGAPLAETTGYTYDEATGEFATVAGAVTVPAATFTQDETTGAWTLTPGTAVLTVTGTI